MLYQKLSGLLNKIMSAEDIDLQQKQTIYHEKEINTLLCGKIDNETNIEIFIKLTPICKD